MSKHNADLSVILDNMMDVYYRSDVEGVCTYVSPSVYELLGYRPEDVVGKEISFFYHSPEMRADIMRQLQENGGRLKGLEHRLLHSDGSVVWISANIQNYYDQAGNIAGVEGVVRDITQHKQAEYELRESEEKFRSIIENMLDIFYRTDSEGRLVMISPSVSQLLGYTPEELMGKQLSSLYVDPTVRDVFLQKLVEQGGKYYGFENNLWHKDGHEVWAVASSQFYYDKDGGVAGVEGIVRDITPRKKMENALRKSEHKLRSILDNMLDTYYRTDVGGRVIMVSPSVRQLLGYSPEEMLGTFLRDHYLDPAFREKILQILMENGGRYRGLEAQLKRKDGQVIWVNTNAAFLYDEANNIIGVEGTTRDITDIKQTEEELRIAKERAETASRAKTEFLSNMSHELRTPLTAIMGFGKLLRQYQAQQLPAKVSEYINNINDASGHLSDLINQILYLSKIEAGQLNVELQAVNLTEVLHGCMRLLRPLAADKGVELNLDSNSCHDEGLPLYVKADALRLRQILINLVNNAISYNREGGHVEIGCGREGRQLILSVKDDGLGIPLAAQQEIFKPFTRAHLDLNIEGSGIGLSVTSHNLQLMGSEIQFSSEPGKGSRFWFALPLMEAGSEVEQEAVVEIPQQPMVQQARVLYVEDNPLALRLMQEVIGLQAGLELLTATTGAEGMELAQQARPDLIILDINLPDTNGIELLSRIKMEPSLQEVPLVALSASAMENEVQSGLDAGFSLYLRKPCDPDYLLQMINELVNRPDESS